jgi:hypothetical protein
MTANWDLVLLVFFAVSLLYSLLLKEKIVVTLLGAYVGMVVATQWGNSLYNLVSQGAVALNQELIQGKISVFAVQIVAFALVILLVAFKAGLLIHPDSVGRGFIGYAALILYGLLTAALIAWSVMNFLPPGTRESITLDSPLASHIMNLGNWWVVLPIILMFFVNLKGYDN